MKPNSSDFVACASLGVRFGTTGRGGRWRPDIVHERASGGRRGRNEANRPRPGFGLRVPAPAESRELRSGGQPRRLFSGEHGLGRPLGDRLGEPERAGRHYTTEKLRDEIDPDVRPRE
jgi:hypothetical protein